MYGTFRPPRDLMLQPFRAWIAAAAASSYHISGLRALTPPPGLRHSPYTPLTHPLSFGLSSFSLLLPWAPDLFRLHELWLFSLVRFHDHLHALCYLLTWDPALYLSELRLIFSCSLPWAPASTCLCVTSMSSSSFSLLLFFQERFFHPSFSSMTSGLSFLDSVLFLYFSSRAYLYYLTVLSYPCALCSFLLALLQTLFKKISDDFKLRANSFLPL